MRSSLRLSVLATVAAAAATAFTAGVSLHSSTVIHAADDPSKPAYYTEKVYPILNNTCYKCHGGANHRGTYNMNTHDSMFKGGKHGTAIVPGHPEQSTMITAVHQTGSEDKPPKPMPPPPKPKLSDADIAVLEAWIKAGAPTPADPLFTGPDGPAPSAH